MGGLFGLFGDSTGKEISQLEKMISTDPTKSSSGGTRIVELAISVMEKTKKYDAKYGGSAEKYIDALMRSGKIDSLSFWNLFRRFARTYKEIGEFDRVRNISAEIWIYIDNYGGENPTAEDKKKRFDAIQHYKECCMELRLQTAL